jgi:DNA-binding transcriptional MerR regulator
VRPTVVDASGSGSRRRYGYTDLLELKVIKSLLDAGIRLENVREIFQYLRDILGQEITSANLVIQGSTSVVIQSDGELIDLIHRGQGVLNILPLGGVRDEMDARIRELRPSDESFLGSGLGDQVASKRVV